MRLKYFFVLSALMVFSSCSSKQSSIALDKFIFPESFDAFQTVKIETDSGSKSLVASLRRNKNKYSLLFLDPVFQKPLMELKGSSKEDIQVKNFTSGRLPFEPQKILEVVMDVYNQKNFVSRGKGFQYRGELFNYDIYSIEKMDGCLFPVSISIKTTDTIKDPKKAVSLQIETKDFECKS